jgi:hypothetical protein
MSCGLEPDNRHLVGEVLFTEVRGIGVLRTSASRNSANFAFLAFHEVGALVHAQVDMKLEAGAP